MVVVLKGICPHCGSKDQRYYERAENSYFRRLACFTCGHTTRYVDRAGRTIDRQPAKLDRQQEPRGPGSRWLHE